MIGTCVVLLSWLLFPAGAAPSPGPMLVPADKLRSLLGLSSVTVVQGNKPLAIVDKTLAG